MSSLSAIPSGDIDKMVEHTMTKFKAFFEGDDGVTAMDGFDKNVVQELGLNLKPDPIVGKHISYKDASFCGIIVGDGEKVYARNPWKTIMDFFTLDFKYAGSKESVHKGLLRAKALSLLTVFRGNPVTQQLCESVLDMTRGMDVRRFQSDFNFWKRASIDLSSSIKKPWLLVAEVSPRTRELVNRHFHMDPSVQLHVENAIRDWHAGRTPCIFVHHSLFTNEQIKYCSEFIRPLASLTSHSFHFDSSLVLYPHPVVGEVSESRWHQLDRHLLPRGERKPLQAREWPQLERGELDAFGV